MAQVFEIFPHGRTVNTMATDALATQGTRALVVMVSTWFDQYILVSVPEGLMELWNVGLYFAEIHFSVSNDYKSVNLSDCLGGSEKVTNWINVIKDGRWCLEMSLEVMWLILNGNDEIKTDSISRIDI